REVGFVDLGIAPYYLYGFVNQDTPQDIVSSFEEISSAAFMGSNIVFEIIDVEKQKEHPAMKCLDLWSIQSFPVAVLVSPDGQTLLVPVTERPRPFQETLQPALDSILFSPKRKEILQQISKTYGAVLLIEGVDAQENKKANQAVLAAIEQVSSQMEFLPKPIEHPPVLIVLEQKSLSQEKILLWSLGLIAEEIKKPHAAVLYGRARWLGPMFIGEQITEDNLASILFIIGGDCECGLDQRWLQGTMLPVKWDEKLLQLATETLEFDPENPMVKMEISWIVRRGYYSYPRPADFHRLGGGDESGLFATGEDESVPGDPNREKSRLGTPKIQQASSVQDVNAASLSTVSSVSEQSVLAENDTSLRKPLYVIVGLTVLIIAGGLFIVLRQGWRSL
ncbi:MAG: hypothetical protein ACE5NM_10770, partial [Sedimentisphaerales bacterium]